MGVLITGSTGFVGKNLAPYLTRAGIAFRPLSRQELSQPDGYEIGAGDSIIHLAGKAHALKTVADSQPYYEINYHLTCKLYDRFLQSSADKFIFISSVKASADQVDEILTETDRPDPHTHYGKSKLMAEEYIMSHLPEGRSVYILRPCMIHGPGNKGNFNLLYKVISTGIPYPLAEFNNQRSFLSIENLCFVIREFLTRSDIPSGIYNIADDEPLSTNELVSLIAHSLGKKPSFLRVNKATIRGLAKVGDLLKLPFNSDRLHKLTENYLVDTTKIKKALNTELPVTARSGIIETISSFKG